MMTDLVLTGLPPICYGTHTFVHTVTKSIGPAKPCKQHAAGMSLGHWAKPCCARHFNGTRHTFEGIDFLSCGMVKILWRPEHDVATGCRWHHPERTPLLYPN